jgi:hypothetical protein
MRICFCVIPKGKWAQVLIFDDATSHVIEVDFRGTPEDVVRHVAETGAEAVAFAIRCTASGRVWVGASRNLDATRNSFWFSLRHGSHPARSLQEEWDVHGEAAFQFGASRL